VRCRGTERGAVRVEEEWSGGKAEREADQVKYCGREAGARAELSELEYRIMPPARRAQMQMQMPPMTSDDEGLGFSASAGACAPVHSCTR
jgi:hypothetical protein